MLGIRNKRLCIVSDSIVDARYGDEVAELLNDRCSKVARFVFWRVRSIKLWIR